MTRRTSSPSGIAQRRAQGGQTGKGHAQQVGRGGQEVGNGATLVVGQNKVGRKAWEVDRHKFLAAVPAAGTTYLVSAHGARAVAESQWPNSTVSARMGIRYNEVSGI